MRVLINERTGVAFSYSESLASQEGIRLMTHDELVERNYTPSGETAKRLGKRLELPADFFDMTKGELNEFVATNKLKTSLNINKKADILRDEVVSLVREHNKDFTDAIEEMPEALPENFYELTVKQLKFFAEKPGGVLKKINLGGATSKSAIQEKIIMELKFQERQELDEPIE